jgi:hypothetical protein
MPLSAENFKLASSRSEKQMPGKKVISHNNGSGNFRSQMPLAAFTMVRKTTTAVAADINSIGKYTSAKGRLSFIESGANKAAAHTSCPKVPFLYTPYASPTTDKKLQTNSQYKSQYNVPASRRNSALKAKGAIVF